MKIRKAEIRDLSALKLISNEQFKNENLRPKFKHLQKDANYQIKIIEDGDNIFGYIVIKCLDKYLFDIYSMAIKQEYQGKGYGKKILEKVLFQSKVLGATIIFLEVRVSNYRAIDFYEKFGFKRDAIRYNYYAGSPKEDALSLIHI